MSGLTLLNASCNLHKIIVIKYSEADFIMGQAYSYIIQIFVMLSVIVDSAIVGKCF